MNIQDLGSIGEFIAAIATLATLIYLAVQIRQNTAAVRGSTIQSVTIAQQQELKWGSEISNAFATGFQNQPMDIEGAWQLTEWYYAAFASRQNEYVQFKRGLLDADVWDASYNIISILACMPLCKEWWDRLGRHAFAQDFCEIVDEIFSRDENIIDFRAELEAMITPKNSP